MLQILYQMKFRGQSFVKSPKWSPVSVCTCTNVLRAFDALVTIQCKLKALSAIRNELPNNHKYLNKSAIVDETNTASLKSTDAALGDRFCVAFC